ncbi:MAG: type II toxin-antitoxin system RelE/ParE family toxin [Methylocella sp.]
MTDIAVKSARAKRGRPGPLVSRGFAQIQHEKACNMYGFTVHLEGMRIRSIRHRGLKRFIEDDDDREIRGDLVNRVRRILTALIIASDMDGVKGPPGWRIHQLAGDRAGTWSVSASGNWRITFTLDSGEICNLNLEDYH